jgi:hypothetical protein
MRSLNYVEVTLWVLTPGWELLGLFLPYLDLADALEGSLWQVSFPGGELFGYFYPYLDGFGSS